MRLFLGILILVFEAGFAQAQTLLIYSKNLSPKTIEGLLNEFPLAPDQNIRATLLNRTERSSVHLVQIRDRENPHIHETHDLFVVLERGEGVLHIGGEEIGMKGRDSVFIPQGTPHYFVSTGKEPAAAIGVFTPPYAGKDSVPADGP